MNIISTPDKITALIARLKKQKKTISFTNGCFDLVHRGHVQYLEKAKSLADILVLGLNSDESVKKLKGSNRPYIVFEDRAFILSRLESVDIVCIFEEETPINLIKKVKPDFLIKGGDYLAEQIVGKDFVESYKGKVITIPFVEGKSSTELIKIIKSN